MIQENSPLSLKERIRLVFGIDLRALAIFRIVLGGMLLTDLLLRWQAFRFMYTDEGCVTREVVSGYWSTVFAGDFNWPLLSVHHFSGSLEYQLALFVLAAVFAVFLMLGCFSRTATVASFLLLASLHARNPMILSSGDMIMKMLLFWSMFLPLGRIWSIDAWRKGRDLKNQKHWLVSAATAGILIQFACMYIFTGISKWNDVWFDGQAMEYVMRLDIYVNSWGKSLLQYPDLLYWISLSTVLLEVFSPFLLFLPFRTQAWRLINIGVYVALHLSIAMTMSIGLFSYISMMGWLIFLPPVVFCGRNWKSSFRFCPPSHSTESQDAQKGSPSLGRLALPGNLALASLIVFVVFWNVHNIYVNHQKRFLAVPVEKIGRLLMLDQHFQMFDRPPTESPWFVYEAQLKDHTWVDLYTGSKPVHDKPTSVRLQLGQHHIRKLHRNLVIARNNAHDVDPIQQKFREALGKYHVKQWNESHGADKQVRSFRLICYSEPIGPDYNGVDRLHRVWFEISPPGSVFERELQRLEDGDFF